MFDIIKYFEGLYPEYDGAYYESIVFRFAVVGGDRGKSIETQRRAKAFSNIYELYMYVAFLGMQQEHRVEWVQGTERRRFEEIKDWTQHRELSKFLEMALFAKSSIDLSKLDDMDEQELKSEMTGLKRLLEEYANGGFEILNRKIKENPTYFEDDYCFINLLCDIRD